MVREEPPLLSLNRRYGESWSLTSVLLRVLLKVTLQNRL